MFLCVFKGTQAWDILKCILAHLKTLFDLYQYFKKCWEFSYNFCQNFDVWTFLRWLSKHRTSFLLQKSFLWTFILVLLWFLAGFWKFSFFVVKIAFYLVFTVLFQKFLHALTESMWNNFSHTVSTLKRFHRWLSQHWTNFFPCLGSN